MFRKILYPTDFSEYARAMLECTGEPQEHPPFFLYLAEDGIPAG